MRAPERSGHPEAEAPPCSGPHRRLDTPPASWSSPCQEQPAGISTGGCACPAFPHRQLWLLPPHPWGKDRGRARLCMLKDSQTGPPQTICPRGMSSGHPLQLQLICLSQRVLGRAAGCAQLRGFSTALSLRAGRGTAQHMSRAQEQHGPQRPLLAEQRRRSMGGWGAPAPITHKYPLEQ